MLITLQIAVEMSWACPYILIDASVFTLKCRKEILKSDRDLLSATDRELPSVKSSRKLTAFD